jgi:hypothetical protein
MGYVDKHDRMANSYSVSRRTFKWTKNFSFTLLTWQFWIVGYSRLVVQNIRTETFGSFLLEIWWTKGVKMKGPTPWWEVDQILPFRTSLAWNRGKMNTGLQRETNCAAACALLVLKQPNYLPVCKMPSWVLCSAVFSGLPYKNKFIVINRSSGQTGERRVKGEHNKIFC